MTITAVATYAFYYMAVASVASALLAVTRRNPVHSILWVLSLFMHVAGIFLVLHAEFLAAVQVVVYAGAILIFYLFVQMLLDLPEEESGPRFSPHWPLAALFGLSFVVLAAVAQLAPLALPRPDGGGEAMRTATADSLLGKTENIGLALFKPLAFPFEIASLVLLAAIVGAVVLARKRTVPAP